MRSVEAGKDHGIKRPLEPTTASAAEKTTQQQAVFRHAMVKFLIHKGTCTQMASLSFRYKKSEGLEALT